MADLIEYKIALRMVQNALKEEKRNAKLEKEFYEELSKNDNIRESTLDRGTFMLIFLNIFFIVYIFKNNDNAPLTIPNFLMLIIVMLNYISKNDKIESRKSKLESLKEQIKKQDNQISRIDEIMEFLNKLKDEEKDISMVDEVMEFLDSLTDEEKERYLSYNIQ